MASSDSHHDPKQLLSATQNSSVRNSLLSFIDDMEESCESLCGDSRLEMRQTDERLNKSSDYQDAPLNNLDLKNWRSSVSVDGSFKVKKRNQEREMEKKENADQRSERTQEKWFSVQGQIPLRHRSVASRSTGSVCGSSSNVATAPLNSKRQIGSVAGEIDCNYLVTRLMKLRECIKEATKVSEKYGKRLDSFGLQQFGQLSGLVKQLKEEEDLCLTSLQRSLASREIKSLKQQSKNRPNIDTESEVDNSGRQEYDQDLDEDINTSGLLDEEKRSNEGAGLKLQPHCAFDRILLNQQEKLLRTETEVGHLNQNGMQPQINDLLVCQPSLGILRRSGNFKSLDELRGEVDEEPAESTRPKSAYFRNIHEAKDQVDPLSDFKKLGPTVSSSLEAQQLKLTDKNQQLHSMLLKLQSLQQERLLLKNELASSVSDVWGNDSNSVALQLLHGFEHGPISEVGSDVDAGKMSHKGVREMAKSDKDHFQGSGQGDVAAADFLSDLSSLGNAEDRWPLTKASESGTFISETATGKVRLHSDGNARQIPDESVTFLKDDARLNESKSLPKRKESERIPCLEVENDDYEEILALQEKLSELKQAKEMMTGLTERMLAFTDLPTAGPRSQSNSATRQRPSSVQLPNASGRNADDFHHDQSEFDLLLEDSNCVREQHEQLRKLQNAIDKDEEGNGNLNRSLLDESVASVGNRRSSHHTFDVPNITNYRLPSLSAPEFVQSNLQQPCESTLLSENVSHHARKQMVFPEELRQMQENMSSKLKTQNRSIKRSNFSFVGNKSDVGRLNPGADVTMTPWGQSNSGKETATTPSDFSDKRLAYSMVDSHAWDVTAGQAVPANDCEDHVVVQNETRADDSDGNESHTRLQAKNLSALCKEVESLKKILGSLTLSLREKSSLSEEQQLQKNQLFIGLNQCLFQLLASQNSMTDRLNQLERIVYRCSYRNVYPLEQLWCKENSIATDSTKCLPKATFPHVKCGQFPSPGKGKLNTSDSSNVEHESAKNRSPSKSNEHSIRRLKRSSGRNCWPKPHSGFLFPAPHQNEYIDGNSRIKTIKATNSGLVDKETHRKQTVADREPLLHSGNVQKCGKDMDSRGVKCAKTSRLSTASDSYDELVSSSRSSGTERKQRLIGENFSVEHIGFNAESNQNKLTSSSHDRSAFEFLKDTIYSEVETLVTLNEHCPHYLIRLFQELQLLTTDSLRQRALRAIQNISAKDSTVSTKHGNKQNHNDPEAVRSDNLDPKFDYSEEVDSTNSVSSSKNLSRVHRPYLEESGNVMVDAFRNFCRRNFESGSQKSEESTRCDDSSVDFATKQCKRNFDTRPQKGQSRTSGDKWRMTEMGIFNSIKSNDGSGSGNLQRTIEDNQTEDDCTQDSDG